MVSSETQNRVAGKVAHDPNIVRRPNHLRLRMRDLRLIALSESYLIIHRVEASDAPIVVDAATFVISNLI